MQVKSVINKLISDWMSDDENKINKLMEVMKEIINPTKKTCFILFGNGNNGKSTFLSLISSLVTSKRIGSPEDFSSLSEDVVIVEEDTENFYDYFMNVDSKVCLYACNNLPSQLDGCPNVEVINFDNKFTDPFRFTFNEQDAAELKTMIENYNK